MIKEMRIAWVCLIISGLLEIVWAYFMKLSDGFTELIPSVFTLMFLMPSFFLLERGVRYFGIGLSYAVFTGIGIAGTTVIDIVLLGGSINVIKIVSLTVLLTGIIGLKFCGNGNDDEKKECDM